MDAIEIIIVIEKDVNKSIVTIKMLLNISLTNSIIVSTEDKMLSDAMVVLYINSPCFWEVK